MEFFKLAIAKAPIPAIAGFLVYIIYPRMIEKSASDTVLIVLAVLTFLMVFLILI